MRGALVAPTEQLDACGRPRLGSPATQVDGCDRALPASPIGRCGLQRDTRAEAQCVFPISRDCGWSVPRPPATFLGFEMKLAKRLRGRKFRIGKPGSGVVAPCETIDALRWGTSRLPSPSPPKDHDQSPRRGRPGWLLQRD